jgi:hypothetical protein
MESEGVAWVVVVIRFIANYYSTPHIRLKERQAPLCLTETDLIEARLVTLLPLVTSIDAKTSCAPHAHIFSEKLNI